eukprot:CAMPEP_0197846658 /NCGR_PEP_ID=MMETSP1438-20131217/3991_1 /TAXON_ID=1461541 /ORGANISM="Pterosperma sp., Strain CCMP1384" /LENGTH=225 /DNA_ID=CAMNT_0043458379 /DNA_START=101 /DNA_END=774 /DNA_ORIENTATION=-
MASTGATTALCAVLLTIAVLCCSVWGVVFYSVQISKDIVSTRGALRSTADGRVVSTRPDHADILDPLSMDIAALSMEWIEVISATGSNKFKVVGVHKAACYNPEEVGCVDGFEHLYHTTGGFFKAIPTKGSKVIFQQVSTASGMPISAARRGLLENDHSIISSTASGVARRKMIFPYGDANIGYLYNGPFDHWHSTHAFGPPASPPLYPPPHSPPPSPPSPPPPA